MKSKLIILSDLWGIKRSNWTKTYLDILSKNFEIQYYDCCCLGGIDVSNYQETIIHKQFVTSGIKIAIKKLLELEKGRVNILAFSIGGIIAWKSEIQGLDIDKLYIVSSTRLRYETRKPSCYTKLFFGKNDTYKPSNYWLNKLKIKYKISENRSHNMYMKEDYAIELCEEINKDIKVD